VPKQLPVFLKKAQKLIAIDSNQELVEKIKDRVTHAVGIDITDESVLLVLLIFQTCDVAIVCIGDNIEMSILAVAMLRKLRCWSSHCSCD
jgi:trk system potassium uptake protein TrkA